MEAQPYSCERVCSCTEVHSETQLIVITGGPGAGKTAVLEYVRKILCEHVAILPEAATILFGGGFWRLKTPSAMRAAQRTIYHIQNELQNLVRNEKKWAIALCDRGSLDGLAYWPGDKKEFLTELNTTIEKEYAKYTAVIHLSSPTLMGGYNHQNPLRTETAAEAEIIDRRITEIWKNHPNYVHIKSTEDFIEKIHRTALFIQAHLPDCCKKHII